MDKTLMHIYVLVIVFCNIRANEQTVKELHKKGDLIIGGLFPIHKKSDVTENACGAFHLQPGYQYMIAMLFALEQINNNSDLLPNITLGTKIYDTCRSTTIAADRARDFIKETLFEDKDPLVAVVGPFISDVSIATAPLLRVFGIPQVSYGSSSSALSNKELYGNFFRTVPPDTFQVDAIADILEYFGWKYIAAISSKGNYGEKGIADLEKSTQKRGVCVAISQALPFMPKPSDYTSIIQEIQKDTYKDVNIIVLFTSQTDSTGLLQAAMDLNADRFTWVGSSGWSNRMDVIFGKEKIANGSITVNHLGGQVKGFEEYYMNVSSHIQSPWSNEFFSEVLTCNYRNAPKNDAQNCTFNHTLPNMEMSPARVVINAVYALAHALHDMQLTECHGQTGVCDRLKARLRKVKLAEYLKNATFPDAVSGQLMKFNSNQEMDGNYTIMNFQQKDTNKWDYVKVGDWGVVVKDDGTVEKSFRINIDSLSWGNSLSRPPVSVCSRRCIFPFISQPLPLHPKCCWKCVKCQPNQIMVNDTCQSCKQGQRPSVNLSECSMIPLSYPSFEDGVGIACIVLTVLAIICTLSTAFFFVMYRNHPVTKASAKELSAIILAGIFLCYISVFPFLLKPSPLICAICRYLGSICFTFCYAPLLMKTNRIYRIFTRGKKSVTRPSMVSPSSQVLVSAGLISIQAVITTCWVISSPPAIKYHYHSLEVTEIECDTENVALVSNLSYNVVLMAICTLFAFKTRQFPRNFNEAKYIGIMMYLICSVWIIFFPTIINMDSPFAKAFIITASYWLIGTIILIGLFFPKIYIILSSSKQSTQSNQNNSADFAHMAKLQNSSSQNHMHDLCEPSTFLRVDRAHSGHVLGTEGELTKNVNVLRCVTHSGSVTPSMSVTPSPEPILES